MTLLKLILTNQLSLPVTKRPCQPKRRRLWAPRHPDHDDEDYHDHKGDPYHDHNDLDHNYVKSVTGTSVNLSKRGLICF